MASALTPEAFDRLLERLDHDRDAAGEKYEALRRTLTRFFEWRGAPFPDDHADETLDRVSRKLADQVDIANLGGYCYEVARLVCLEALKHPSARAVSLESTGVSLTAPAHTYEGDLRLEGERREVCLSGCLRRLPEDSRQLILEYYGDGGGRPIDRRRALAERLGLQRDALANRAQRVRNKLEACVAECVRGGRGRYESPRRDTDLE